MAFQSIIIFNPSLSQKRGFPFFYTLHMMTYKNANQPYYTELRFIQYCDTQNLLFFFQIAFCVLDNLTVQSIRKHGEREGEDMGQRPELNNTCCGHMLCLLDIIFINCQQSSSKDPKQCVSPSLNTFWRPYPVCGSQHKVHWFPLKRFIFKNLPRICTLFLYSNRSKYCISWGLFKPGITVPKSPSVADINSIHFPQ